MSMAFELMLWPILACILMTGINVYFGSHVLRRGVIFVDLSLAQVAALGSTMAFLFGLELASSTAYFLSLGFALLGAALFSMLRTKEQEIPQEAIIGIVYAVATATTILLVSRQPEGAEHIKNLLIGSLLTVTPGMVLKTAAVYAVVGVMHWVWRDKFWQISSDSHAAIKSGVSVRWWDFLFYGSFAVVVTSSVKIFGVLLVFSLLVVPSTAAILVASSRMSRLLFGWVLGAVVCVAGMFISFYADLPPGATIVGAFGLALVGVATQRALLRRITNSNGTLR